MNIALTLVSSDTHTHICFVCIYLYLIHKFVFALLILLGPNLDDILRIRLSAAHTNLDQLI